MDLAGILAQLKKKVEDFGASLPQNIKSTIQQVTPIAQQAISYTPQYQQAKTLYTVAREVPGFAQGFFGQQEQPYVPPTYEPKNNQGIFNLNQQSHTPKPGWVMVDPAQPYIAPFQPKTFSQKLGVESNKFIGDIVAGSMGGGGGINAQLDYGAQAASPYVRLAAAPALDAVGGAINSGRKLFVDFLPNLTRPTEQLANQGEKKILNVLSETPAQTAYRRQIGLTAQEAYSGAKLTPEQEFELNVLRSPNKPVPQLTQQESQNLLNTARYKAEVNKSTFDKIFARFIGERDSSTTKAIQQTQNIPDIPKGINPMDIINAIENPKTAVSPEVRSYMETYRKLDDQVFKEADRVGIDIGYLRDHISHFWKESQQQVELAYMAFKKSYSLASHRQIPTYEEGIKMGLTPRFTDPRAILADSIRQLEQTKAGIKAFEALKDEGFVVPAGIGANKPGFVPINAPGFPTSKTRLFGDVVVQGHWYAPESIARDLNRVFGTEDFGVPGLIAKGGRKLSGVIQDVTLSGGIPGTPVNAFTTANAMKEITAGRVISPLKAIVRSLNPEATASFFKNNAGQIIKMQENNIPIKTSVTIDSLVGRNVIERIFGGGVQGNWNRLVNNPTFERFMPMLQVQFFNDIEKGLIRSGRPEEEATQLAAKATKNFYGVIGSDTAAKRLGLTEDIKGTFLFAPKFRESMVNFWINNVKAMKAPLAPENINNVRFVIGAIATFGVMDQLNRLYNNGRSMLDNPSGTEDKLLIPISAITGNKSDNNVIGIPFLSSIATIPRGIMREGVMLLKGDIAGAVTDAGQTYLSSAIKPFADVAANKDYFGKQIATDNQTPADRYKSIISYLGTQFLSHPYLKELADPRNQSDPAYQRLSRAMEIPLRFYTKASLEAKQYFASRDNAVRGLSPQEQSAYSAIPSSNQNNPNNAILKYQIFLTYPKVFAAKQLTELSLAEKTGKPIDPLYLVDFTTASKYMRYETLPPGSQERKDLASANPDLTALFDMRSKYFDENPIPGQSNSNRPVASAAVQAAMDRKDWNYPGVKEFLNANRVYQNQQRQLLGLTPLAGYVPYQRKARKIAIKSPRMPGMIKIKQPSLAKALKPPKFKSISAGKLITKIKQPKKIVIKLKHDKNIKFV